MKYKYSAKTGALRDTVGMPSTSAAPAKDSDRDLVKNLATRTIPDEIVRQVPIHVALAHMVMPEITRDQDARRLEHLAALRELGVDLTAYLTQGRADRLIEIRGAAGSHLHLDPGVREDGAPGGAAQGD